MRLQLEAARARRLHGVQKPLQARRLLPQLIRQGGARRRQSPAAALDAVSARVGHGEGTAAASRCATGRSAKLLYARGRRLLQALKACARRRYHCNPFLRTHRYPSEQSLLNIEANTTHVLCKLKFTLAYAWLYANLLAGLCTRMMRSLLAWFVMYAAP